MWIYIYIRICCRFLGTVVLIPGIVLLYIQKLVVLHILIQHEVSLVIFHAVSGTPPSSRVMCRERVVFVNLYLEAAVCY